MTDSKNTCEKCVCNKICDHNKFGFENCNSFLPRMDIEQYDDFCGELCEYAKKIINQKQAEIDRLNSCVKSEDEVRAIMKAQMEPMVKEITNEQIDLANKLGRIDGILKFAERLKNEDAIECDVSLGYGRPCYEDVIPIIAIDTLVKEMVGEQQ